MAITQSERQELDLPGHARVARESEPPVLASAAGAPARVHEEIDREVRA